MLKRAAGLVFVLVAPAVAQSNAEWYGIERYPDRCTVQGGPGRTIELAQTTGDRYVANDTKDASGTIVQTTITLPDRGLQITYYRGAARCQAVLEREKATQRSDRDRYR